MFINDITHNDLVLQCTTIVQWKINYYHMQQYDESHEEYYQFNSNSM